jgi:hypothetical protein
MCILELGPDGSLWGVKRWDVVDVAASAGVTDLNVNSVKVEVLVDIYVRGLLPFLDAWLEGVSMAFLESQPLGSAACNVKTKTLSHVLQAMIVSRGIPVRFVSPSLKLRAMTEAVDGEGYAANKKFAVRFALKTLDESGMGEWSAWFGHKVESKEKCDDMADAFLQGLLAGQDEIVQRKKEAAKALRKQKSATSSGKRKRNEKEPSEGETQERLQSAGKKRPRAEGLGVGTSSLTLGKAGVAGAGAGTGAGAGPRPKRLKKVKRVPTAITLGLDEALNDDVP